MEWRCPGRPVRRAGPAGAACSRSREARRGCALALALACPLALTPSALTGSKEQDGSGNYVQVVVLVQNMNHLSHLY